MRTIQWTDRMTTLLMELYPVETTSHTATVLGVSETLVKRKARKLGLVKVAKTKWMERADYIRRHFHYKSFTQMARDLGTSRTNVCNIAAKLGLKRSRPLPDRSRPAYSWKPQRWPRDRAYVARIRWLRRAHVE